MSKKIVQLFVSAFLYWLVTTCARYFLEVPPKIIDPAIFLSPVLGLAWGLPAAAGAYFGSLFVAPEFQNFFFAGNGIFDLFLLAGQNVWIFAAGFLPYFLWHRWRIFSEKISFSLSVHTLKKFLAIMLVTFALTSALKTFTAPAEELQEMTGWLISGKSATFLNYLIACFVNDFFTSMFFDLAIFFLLVSRNYPFHNPRKNFADESAAQILHSVKDTNRTWIITLGFYMIFPVAVVYVNKYQIYGMDHLETWLRFIAECLSAIDIYLVLVFYLLLRYRRSIMLEIVFLVSQTVFLSATVLGFGSSVALNNMATSSTDHSLHAMSVICRERLDRTFFCVRQAVNGMEIQALNEIESYNRLVEDPAYREEYLRKMEKNFSAIARTTDGSIAYYLRLAPEFAGSKGGFSMAREDVRWEGALAPFVRREPIDLSLYSPDDVKNVGWYYMPMKSRCATWIEPYVDPTAQAYVISFVAPLFVEGNFIGVIGMDIDFNFIIQELRRMSIYDYGYVYIMNRNNVVLYHRDQPQGTQFQPNPEFQEMEIYLSNGMWLGIAMPLSRVHETRNEILMHLMAAIIIVAMIISVVSIELTSQVIKPLSGMTDAAKRIASGDLNVKISYEYDNELGILVRSIREMATRLEDYVYRDKLTGLRNAAAYISKAAELDAQRNLIPDLQYGVVIFDANFLKKINDNYGHEAGNELLRHAAKVIREVFANSPVYRIGGDEFAAVLENQDYENRAELMRLFNEKVPQEHFDIAGETIMVSVACGLGIYERGMDFSGVSKKADVAMYNHKAAIKAKFGEEVR